jgi:hypothetical protein
MMFNPAVAMSITFGLIAFMGSLIVLIKYLSARDVARLVAEQEDDRAWIDG